MDEKRSLLRHFLAALAYRTQKALRDAPPEFGFFKAAEGIRTPVELVRHMTSVLGYARTFFVGDQSFSRNAPGSSELHRERSFSGVSAERMLQGPFSDAMTHAGQLTMLRRLAGSPVAPENFVFAEIDAERLGRDQAEPVSPDEIWQEAPAEWLPPSRRK
jgi:hypothetical protein